MNYERTAEHESGNMLSAEQLYLLEMYRALSEESLRALCRSELPVFCWIKGRLSFMYALNTDHFPSQLYLKTGF